MFVKILAVLFVSLAGTALAAAPRLQTCVEGPDWVRLENLHEIVAGSALDFSAMGLQEAPAGKYGWLKSVNGHAEFERRPGRPARFYGVNLCMTANYLADDEIERFTDRLVRLGYNSIRIHHHDDAWAKDLDGAREKFDKLVASCVRKGIYLTTDLYVSRTCTWRELGVDRDGLAPMDEVKLRMMTSEAAYANWQAYARAFLSHRNPHTGRTLAEEPALPFLVVINESSPHSNWQAARGIPEFRPLWREWLAEARTQTPGAYPEEEPEKFPESGGWWNPGTREDAGAAFWAWVNGRFCRKAMKFLRDELKVKALLTTENNGPALPEILRVRAATGDYVDTHCYTADTGAASKAQRQEIGAKVSHVYHDLNVLAACRRPYRTLAFTRVWGRPFTISESSMAGPNSYRALAGLVTGAYAAVQDWSAVWTFAMAHGREKMFDGCRVQPGRYDLGLDPLSQATDRLPTLLFLRGDQVTPRTAYANVFTPAALDPSDDRHYRSSPDWASLNLGWRARLGVSFGEPLPDGVCPVPVEPPGQPQGDLPSVGVEVDEKRGAITVAGPFTCGGFAETNATISAGILSAKVSGFHAAVAATSLDRTPLADSPRLLLWHLTDLHGDGFTWGGSCRTPAPCGVFTGIVSWGDGDKILARVGETEVALALKCPERYAVYALDTVGNRKSRVASACRDGNLVFTACVRQAFGGCLYYEIVRE